MKNTIILIAAFTALSFQVEAQTAEGSKARFGIYGGVNFQTINGKDANGTTLENSIITKFHAGINEEIPLAPDFKFQVGVQYIGKGAKGDFVYNTNGKDVLITREINLSYIEVPLNLVYKPLLGTGNLILGFGPYVGYSFGGKAKFSGTDAPADRDVNFTKTAPANELNNLANYKPLDVGSNFFFGYELRNGINFVFNASLGLININSQTTNKLAEKNTGFGLSLGYRFK